MSQKNVVSSSINFVSTVVYVSFLLNLAIAAKPKGFSMKMIRSDSKESPLYPRYANLTQAERFRGLVEQSKARVRHLGSARAAAYNQTSTMNPIVPITYLENRVTYFAEVGLGTFNGKYKKFYLEIDTGSDLTWTQCPGGRNYFYQDAPLYDHTHSTTYTPISCDQLPDQCDGKRCKDGLCTYKVRYVSREVTSGQLAHETFTTKSLRDPNYRHRFKNTIIGCGLDQRNFGGGYGVPETHDGGETWIGTIRERGNAPIAGMLGLGQGTFSFVLQKADYTGKRFEYCLGTYNLEGVDVSHTYLRFGSDTIIGEGPEVLTTPIFHDLKYFDSPYFLNLLGISVHHKKLRFEQGDFAKKEDGSGGTIIDSGTSYTIMMSRFYEEVEEELIDYFKGFGIHVVPPKEGFQTCFGVTDDFEELPTMTFHFLGANYVIGLRSGMFLMFKDDEVDRYKLCLAIRSMPDDQAFVAVTIGAMQQANKRMKYDLRRNKLSFRDEECITGS